MGFGRGSEGGEYGGFYPVLGICGGGEVNLITLGGVFIERCGGVWGGYPAL